MAEAVWTGSLRLSLVSCPIYLTAAVSNAKSIKLDRLSARTGNPVTEQFVDAKTGDVVPADALAKGYEFDKSRYVTVSEDELKTLGSGIGNIIDLEQFVLRQQIDPLHLGDVYFVHAEGRLASDTLHALRVAMQKSGRVALGHVRIGDGERPALIEPYRAGLMMSTLRTEDELIAPGFAERPQDDIPVDMVEIAETIISRRAGDFDAKKLRDRYQDDLKKLVEEKAKKSPAPAAANPPKPAPAPMASPPPAAAPPPAPPRPAPAAAPPPAATAPAPAAAAPPPPPPAPAAPLPVAAAPPPAPAAPTPVAAAPPPAPAAPTPTPAPAAAAPAAPPPAPATAAPPPPKPAAVPAAPLPAPAAAAPAPAPGPKPVETVPPPAAAAAPPPPPVAPPPAAAAPRPAPAPPEPTTHDVGTEILLHIMGLGDRRYVEPGWAGNPGSKRQIEALSIRPRDGLAASAIEFRVFAQEGRATAWVSNGNYAGTRGRNLPLTGFAVRPVTELGERLEIAYEGSFFEGGVVGPKKNGELCVSPVADDPLEAVRVTILDQASTTAGDDRK
jgi:DNA end-binding protein Ku